MDQRTFFLEQYRSMDTEELIDRHRRGNLTEVASAVLEEVLTERKVSPQQRAEVAQRLKEESYDEQFKHLAPLSRRFSAQVTDSIIALVFGGVAGLAAVPISNRAVGIAGALVWLGYMLFADGLPSGQSFGKHIAGTAVIVKGTGKPCGYGRSFVRNITLLVLGLIDWVFIFGERRQRIGDMLAGTEVVNIEYLRDKQASGKLP